MVEREFKMTSEGDPGSIGFTQIDNRSWEADGRTFKRLDWRNILELEKVGELQNVIWGFGQLNVVPCHLLGVIEETGGDVLMVTGPDQKPEGFALTLATSDPRKRFLHMVGVLGQKQSTSVGRKLMLLEGSLSRLKGVDEIWWTYDPLMGANSQLYVARLGATPCKYTINKYGVVANSDTNTESRYKNVETDRFTVKWSISDPKVWNRAVEGVSPMMNIIDYPEWDGSGSAPDIFKVGVPYDFTTLTTDQMMDARMALRRIAARTLDLEDISNRSYQLGSHNITAFAKGDGLKNHYLFSKKTL